MNPIELKFLRVATEKHPTTGITLEYLNHHNAIAVMILDFEGKNTLLVNQYRPGNRSNMFEVPAGLIDANEDENEAMFREILEETGYKKEDLDLVYKYPKGLLISPGYTTEKLNFYIVKLKKEGIIPEEQSLDFGEDLFTQWVSLDKVEGLEIDLKTVFLLNLYKTIKK